MTRTGRGDAQQAAVGVFDSGLGGLTVVRAIRRSLPGERLVYLGDNARVPYGTRSASTVLSYARACARKLRDYDIKFLVVACNTVSAVALETLALELELPVLGVIGPGARAAVRSSSGRKIGVLATTGTVDSGAYERAITAADARAEVWMQAAPLLVPLAEEGWVEGEVPRLTARRYLQPLLAAGVDTLLLGCTHYPILRAPIEAEMRSLAARELTLIDSAHATAQELASELSERALLAGGEGALRLLVTDMPRRFGEVASRFLGDELSGVAVEQVDL